MALRKQAPIMMAPRLARARAIAEPLGRQHQALHAFGGPDRRRRQADLPRLCLGPTDCEDRVTIVRVRGGRLIPPLVRIDLDAPVHSHG
jgi:hypothetical protein